MENLHLFRPKDISCLENFYCGVEEMDYFIHHGLYKKLGTHHCQLYTLVNDAHEVVAMFALSSDALFLDSDSKDDLELMSPPSFNDDEPKADAFWSKSHYPAVDIAYLAVAKEYRDKHIGKDIVLRIVQMMRKQCLVGCQFITVDAYKTPDYSAVGFYSKCNFIAAEIPNAGKDTLRMFLPIM